MAVREAVGQGEPAQNVRIGFKESKRSLKSNFGRRGPAQQGPSVMNEKDQGKASLGLPVATKHFRALFEEKAGI